MLRILIVLTLLAGILILAPQANAQSLQYSALLDGPSESPPNGSPGTGFSLVDLNLTAHTMRVRITFSALVGTTTAAHIHAPTAVAFTGVAGVASEVPSFTGFPLGVTSGSMDTTFDMTLATSYNPSFITANGGTTASAEAALAGYVAAGRAYVNIHSSTFPGGEIRGFLVAVPEPSTIALIGAGALGLGLYDIKRRLKKRTVRGRR